MISTHRMSASSVKMKWNLVGELIICDIAHMTQTAFGDLLRWPYVIIGFRWAGEFAA